LGSRNDAKDRKARRVNSKEENVTTSHMKTALSGETNLTERPPLLETPDSLN